MRLNASMAFILPCLLLGWAGILDGAETPSKENTCYAEAIRFSQKLSASRLPEPNPEERTEEDLLIDQASGGRPADPTFCARIELNAISERLLPMLEGTFQEDLKGRRNYFAQELFACRVFMLRGQLLCQEGKVAGAQSWFLKVHRMARRPHSDRNLSNDLSATAIEIVGLSAVAGHIETWTARDRLTYMRSLEALQTPGRIDVAARRDNDSLPKEEQVGTLITSLKPLTPAQREQKLMALCGTPTPSEDKAISAQRIQRLIENLTTETWQILVADISSELQPLKPKKLKLFEARNAEALRLVEAEEAGKNPTKWAAPAQKAGPYYRVTMGGSIAVVARYRLEMELKSKLLKVALQRGRDFGEPDLAGLTDASGNPLHLGLSEEGNRKAINVGTTIDDILVIGPIK